MIDYIDSGLQQDNDDICIAKNEIFYTTANAAQMREKTFLKNRRYMGSYWLEDKHEKQC